jgi:LemA protein
MAHERETLDAVIKARNTAFAAGQKAAGNPGDPQAMKELNQAEAQLGGVLGRLIALSEAYPDLKANQNMLSLQEELSSTENKISFARQAFNDAVTSFNNQRQVFPAVMVAGMFGFTPAAWLEAESGQREAPKVSFK